MQVEFVLFAISILVLGVSTAFLFVPVVPRAITGTVSLLSLAFLLMLLYIKERRNAKIQRTFNEYFEELERDWQRKQREEQVGKDQLQ